MYFTRGVGEMQKVRPDGQQESLYRPFFSDVFSSLNPNDFLGMIDDIRYATRSGLGGELLKGVVGSGSNTKAFLWLEVLLNLRYFAIFFSSIDVVHPMMPFGLTHPMPREPFRAGTNHTDSFLSGSRHTPCLSVLLFLPTLLPDSAEVQALLTLQEPPLKTYVPGYELSSCLPVCGSSIPQRY